MEAEIDRWKLKKFPDDIFPTWESPSNFFHSVCSTLPASLSGCGCDTRYGETSGEFASSLGLLARLGGNKP